MVPCIPCAPVAPVVPWAPVSPVAPCKLKFDLNLRLPLASATIILVSVVPAVIVGTARLPLILTEPVN